MEQILKIEKLVHGGRGLSRTSSGVVFVSGALPGETVRANINASSGGVPAAECIEVIEPSPDRCVPACPHAGLCGGCDWLHIDCGRQLAIKREIFSECLVRTGKLKDIPDIRVHASPELAYRRRVQFQIDPVKNIAGFFKKRSNEVVAISRCPLLCDPLNLLLSQLPPHIKALRKDIVQIKAIAGTERSGLDKQALFAIASSPVVPGVTAASAVIQIESYHFAVSGNGFFQSNLFLTGALGLCAQEWLSGEVFWDLYGGTGFFSVFAAPRFSSGVLIDNEQNHVASARMNFAANGISHVSPIAKTAAQFVETARRNGKKPDCIIFDPPRTGLDIKVRRGIAELLPRTLLYVSCDPATQARDAGFFVNKCGYRLEKAALFDFYPQTHHMETALLLRRS